MKPDKAQVAVAVHDLCKHYNVYDRPSHMLSEMLLRRPRHHRVNALQGVSFSVSRGEILGIVGRNGAGKSTLLKLLTGVLKPNSGTIDVYGKVSHLLELGGGFNPHYSGRENIYFGGACMGMSRREIDRKLDSIIAFSELGADIDRTFRTYSTGMQARLTFALAISIDPEILIIDEVLAVGDARFALKCYDKIREFRERGVTILYVTHNYDSLLEFCDHGMVLDQGRLVHFGDPSTAIMIYNRIMYGDQPKAEPSNDPSTPTVVSTLPVSQESNKYEVALDSFMSQTAMDFSKRIGSKEAVFSRIAIVNDQNEATTLLPPEKAFSILFEITFKRPLTSPKVGFWIKDRLGRIICSTATGLFPDVPLAGLHQKGSRVIVIFTLRNTLSGGRYFLGAAMAGDDGRRIDDIHDVVMFEVLRTPLIFTDCIVNMSPTVSAVRLDDGISAAHADAEVPAA